jgi:cytochrome c oxidase accessory protein FixG
MNAHIKPAEPPPPPHALFANRVRVYAKAVQGPVRRAKWAILCVCLGIYYLLPWLRWNRGPGRPDQAVLLDITHERFYFFSLEFWPQDIYYLTGLLIMAAVSLFLVTSLAGRVWCGYTCPQTVWTDLFMFVERRIEGDRHERMQRDAGPRSFDYAWRKLAKHATWLAIAFWTGGAWIMYYVNAPTAVHEFWTGQAATPVYVFTALFTATTYLLAGWAREQVCTYMCPWPRFQSAMLDEQSITVTYQAWRGEPRSRHLKRVGHEAPAGDCIDCAACVTVCPTGIDIRDGIQMECINCGLCVDACNTVMDRIGRDRGLITWDTLARQAAKASGRHEKLHLFRTRTLIYVATLLIASGAMVASVLTYAKLGVTIEHDRAPLFVRLADGSLRNGFTLRIANKSQAQAGMVLTASGVPGARIAVAEMGGPPADHAILPVGPDSVAAFRVLVSGPAIDGQKPLAFTVRNPNTGETAQRIESFIGPNAEEGISP